MKVIVVLGCQVDPATGLPGPVLETRLDQTLQLYRSLNTDDTIIVVSGGGSFPESRVMKDYLVEHGIPHHKIFEECNSRNTVENCLYTFKFLDEVSLYLSYQEITSSYPNCNYYEPTKWGPVKVERIWVVSSEFHIPRVCRIFSALNIRNWSIVYITSQSPPEMLDRLMLKESKVNVDAMLVSYMKFM